MVEETLRNPASTRLDCKNCEMTNDVWSCNSMGFGRRFGKSRKASRLAKVCLRTHFVADHINSIMGLREALTSRTAFLRAVWTTLVIIGFGATAFYLFRNTQEYLNKDVSTKSGLQTNVSYDLPPIIVCPPWPFDTDDLARRGLDPDGLTYSLGYAAMLSQYLDTESSTAKMIEPMSPETPNDLRVLRANERFFVYYNKIGFRSAADYFMNIMVEVETEAMVGSRPIPLKNGTFIIRDSRAVKVLANNISEKIVFSNGMCYRFQLRHATRRTTQEPGILNLYNFDHTRGVIDPTKKNWRIDLFPNILPSGPMLILEPFYKYTIKLTAQRIIKLRNAKSCIVDEESTDPTQCSKDCFNRIYGELGQHEALLSNDSKPSELHNQFDTCGRVKLKENELVKNGILNRSRIDGMDANEREITIWTAAGYNITALRSVLDPDDERLQKCYDSCLPSCDRTIYDVSISKEVKLTDEEGIDDQSSIALSVKHTAVFQGGIMTLEEVATVTFSDFVSNIGGTLGLFLGCTVMTFAQIFMAILSHLIRKR